MSIPAAAEARAKASFAAGEYEAAVEAFGLALQESTAAKHLILCNRSAAFLKLGRTREARADADQAVLICQDFVQAH